MVILYKNIFILDIPASLPEAEKLLSQHQTIKEEIDNYKDEYAKMMEYGEKITAVSIVLNQFPKQCFVISLNTRFSLSNLYNNTYTV